MPISSMMKKLVAVVMVFIFGLVGYQISPLLLGMYWMPAPAAAHPIVTTVIIVIIAALLGLIIAPFFWWLLVKLRQFFESKIQTMSLPDVTVSMIGLILGLLLANLIAIPLSNIPGSIGVYIAILLNLALGYWGFWIFNRRREDIWAMLTNADLVSKFSRKKDALRNAERHKKEGVPAGSKVLDTSAIIDGRIMDVAKTGFIEGTIILPRFVLTELQAVADSADAMKRTRGRRGLSVVSELQKMGGITIEISDATLQELERDKVDEALVVLAHRLNGKVITTDYNLNKVAQIEGVEVLNVNDLANSLKPMLMPGEKVTIDIIRLGKENHQGIGYLDDGTMLVVEDGSRYVGDRVTVTVTSMLQTSAGRMVFGRVHP
ncbi:MAG: TRAM domain-containing protein [Synergistes sp.]|nr:TRAM domain-containing protein [Synergistes sp.]